MNRALVLPTVTAWRRQKAAHISSRAVPAIALCALLSVIAGCSTMRPRMPAEPDPVLYLPRGAALYARFTKPALKDLAPSILPGDRTASFAALVDRTSTAAIGTTPAGPSGMNYDLAIVGDYSRNSVDLALSVNPEWRKDGQSFVNDPSGIQVASPADRLVLARSIGNPGPEGRDAEHGSANSLAQRLKSFDPAGNSPLPPRFVFPYGGDIFIWIPDPFTAFAAYLPSEGFDIPIIGICILAKRLESVGSGGSPLYLSSISFVMKDSESARIYRPSLKFAWFALSKAFIGDENATAKEAEARFVLEGDSYVSRGLEIPASTYSSLFRMTTSAQAQGM